MSRLSLSVALAVLLLTACTPPRTMTKQEAFPQMYERKPVALLVLPPVNNSTAAEAKGYYTSTILIPLAEKGYYVFPIELVTEILRREGVPDTELLLDSHPGMFRQYFGADAVLFIVIQKWDTNYYVLGGNVTVQIGYILKDTESGETLWSYEDRVVVDTTASNQGGGAAGALAALIATAIQTATTDYVPIAQQVNGLALASLPFGKYHAEHGQDGQAEAVLADKIQPR